MDENQIILPSQVLALSPKKQKFVIEYVKDMNGTRAAKASGYSANTATEQASRLLANVKVAAAVTALLKLFAIDSKVSVEYVLSNFYEISERAMGRKPVPAKILCANQMQLGLSNGVSLVYDPEVALRANDKLGQYNDMWNGVESGDEGKKVIPAVTININKTYKNNE